MRPKWINFSHIATPYYQIADYKMFHYFSSLQWSIVFVEFCCTENLSVSPFCKSVSRIIQNLNLIFSYFSFLKINNTNMAGSMLSEWSSNYILINTTVRFAKDFSVCLEKKLNSEIIALSLNPSTLFSVYLWSTFLRRAGYPFLMVALLKWVVNWNYGSHRSIFQQAETIFQNPTDTSLLFSPPFGRH